MSADSTVKLALIVRTAPYAGRAPRDQLDLALAAATLEMPLEIYFLGPAVWQLASARDTAAAALPKGLKGWSAIGDLTRARFFATRAGHALLSDAGVGTVVELESMDQDEMQARWRQCERVMVL